MRGSSVASVVRFGLLASVQFYGWWVGGAAGLIATGVAIVLLVRAAVGFEAGIYPSLWTAIKWIFWLLVAHLALYTLNRELAVEVLDFMEWHIVWTRDAIGKLTFWQQLGVVTVGMIIACIIHVVERRARR